MAVNALSRRVTPSELRFRVTIKTSDQAANAPALSGTTVRSANIEPLGVAATQAQQMMGSEAQWRITFRPEVTVSVGDVIVHGGVYYVAESVRVVPRARVEAFCKVTA